MRLVLVDVDGTLLAGRSEVQFIRHLILGRRLGARALLRSCAFALSHATLYGRQVWKKNKAYLAGLASAEIEELAEAYVRERLVRELRQPVLARIADHRARGDRILLLTGTPDFIARPLAQAIGAEGCIATSCATRSGLFMAETPVLHPFAAEKLRLAEAAAAECGFSLAACVAYADSIHDYDLLQAVGRPVAVAPDPKLLALARRAGWEVLEASPRAGWLESVRAIVPRQRKAATRPL